MIYIVGITLFVVCFLLLVRYLDWLEEMDEPDDDRDEWRGK